MNAAQQKIFETALELPDQVEREAMLDRACDGDPQLRERINELLVAHGQADQFFTDYVTSVASSAEQFIAANTLPAGLYWVNNLAVDGTLGRHEQCFHRASESCLKRERDKIAVVMAADHIGWWLQVQTNSFTLDSAPTGLIWRVRV